MSWQLGKFLTLLSLKLQDSSVSACFARQLLFCLFAYIGRRILQCTACFGCFARLETQQQEEERSQENLGEIRMARVASQVAGESEKDSQVTK